MTAVMRWRRRQQARGLCTVCTRKAWPGNKLCALHKQLSIWYCRAYRRRIGDRK